MNVIRGCEFPNLWHVKVRQDAKFKVSGTTAHSIAIVMSDALYSFQAQSGPNSKSCCRGYTSDIKKDMWGTM